MAKRDYILHNFWWKVTSLLLAIIVWMVVHGTSGAGDPIPRMQRRFPPHTLSLMRAATDKSPTRLTPNDFEPIASAPMT
jgi:hypothetical protein